MWRSVKTVEVFTCKVAHAFSCHSWWESPSKMEQTQKQEWKGRKIQVFQSSFDSPFDFQLKNPDLSSLQELPWWLFSSSTLYWVPYGTWWSPAEILAIMKSTRVLSLPYTRLPLVTMRKSLITVYLSFFREYNAFLFDRGAMRTISWCLGTTSCDTDNRHRKVCVGHWIHSILMTLESKRAFKQNFTG